ncbi:hypothetical protein [Solirubrum puertoriconensis]|uniref:Uncharacterized protein n=1 Tax=Solirubrum puertoriconensis TaxID=1751427 RepID=A0A9X0HJF2_SOLP1|nr:hypothetical protein [Solirubrum puertoriconensis]KUG06971.1 hypothetical protein ASU33_06520 [Solirubrum puertoriconensis]
MSKQPQKENTNPTNQESSGADKVGMANSGQNQFPLKKDAKDAADRNGKQNDMPSAGSQVRSGAKHVDSGKGNQDQQ